MTRANGPLHNLGPAARWCLTAGLVSDPHPPATLADFQNEGELLLNEGLAPVAFQGIESQTEWQVHPMGQAFYSAAMAGHLRSMAADAAGAKVISALTNAGISVAVIKGPSVARLHPQAWPRSYSDIDVVVSKREFSNAVSCSLNEGFEYSDRSIPQWRWFNLVCREGVNLHAHAGGNIDIHHHVPPWAFCKQFTVEHVIANSIPANLCGIPIDIATAEDQLLIASLHVLNDLWKGKIGLRSWRDIVAIMNSLGGDSSAQAFDSAGLGWLFALVTEALTNALPDVEFESSGVIDGQVPMSIRWRLEALGWSRQTSFSRHRLSWATRLPTANALAYLAGTAFPSPGYIRDRHGSLFNYWKAGWNETLSTRHGSDFRMTTVEDKLEGEQGIN